MGMHDLKGKTIEEANRAEIETLRSSSWKGMVALVTWEYRVVKEVEDGRQFIVEIMAENGGTLGSSSSVIETTYSNGVYTSRTVSGSGGGSKDYCTFDAIMDENKVIIEVSPRNRQEGYTCSVKGGRKWYEHIIRN